MIKTFVVLLCLTYTQIAFTQSVGINTTGANPDSTAMLDIAATDKGILIPRMTATQRAAISTPALGLMVYDNTANTFMYYNGDDWVAMGGSEDTLGNHIALQNVQLNGHWLSSDGDDEGIYVDSLRQVGIGTIPTAKLHVHTGTDRELLVTDSSIMINRVQYPITDGTANQTLRIVEVDSTNNWARAEWRYLNSDHEDLTISEDTLWISSSSSFADLTNLLDNTDNQELSLSGNILSISNSAATVDLSPYDNNTDAQTLSFSNDTLYLTNNSPTYLGVLAIGDNQDLSINNHELSLAGDPTATPINLSDLIDADNMGNHTATQNIELNNHWLSNDGDNEGIQIDANGQVGVGITPQAKFHVQMGTGNPGFKVDDTGITFNEYTFPLADGTANQILTTDGVGNLSWNEPTIIDNQQLSLSGNTLYISNGNGLNLGGFMDNTDNQSLSLSGNTLHLTNDPTPVDLSTYVNLDNQQISLSNDTLALSNDPTSINLSDYKQDFYISNDSLYLSHDNTPFYLGEYKQGLGLANDSLTISNVNSPVDLSGYIQSLSKNGHVLSLTDGGADIDLSAYSNTDNQQLTMVGNQLSITGGNSVDLSSYIVPDNQQMTVSNDTLYLSNNLTTMDLSRYLDSDSLGDHIALQNVKLNGHFVSSDGDTEEGIYVATDGSVGIGTVPSNTFHMKMASFPDGFQVSTTGVGIGRAPVTNKLEVNGDASKSTAGAWAGNSDARLKKNLVPLSPQQTLEKMLSLQGVTFLWDDQKTGVLRPEGIQYGFTAQNIQEQFPTMVNEDNMGYLQTAYGSLDAMKVEALRALNGKIESLRERNESLLDEWKRQEAQLSRLGELRKEVAELKSSLGK